MHCIRFMKERKSNACIVNLNADAQGIGMGERMI